MAGPIYSTQFACEHVTSAPTTLYVVPVGFIAVVRHIVADNIGGSTDSLEVDTTISGPAEVVIARFNDVPATTAVYWEGRAVLNSGQEIVSATLGNDWTLLISGYLLSTP